MPILYKMYHTGATKLITTPFVFLKVPFYELKAILTNLGF